MSRTLPEVSTCVPLADVGTNGERCASRWPMFTLSYIFTPLLAGLVLGEQVTWERWAGVFVICMGVALVGQSRR